MFMLTAWFHPVSNGAFRAYFIQRNLIWSVANINAIRIYTTLYYTHAIAVTFLALFIKILQDS